MNDFPIDEELCLVKHNVKRVFTVRGPKAKLGFVKNKKAGDASNELV
jgi:hypothetical protein